MLSLTQKSFVSGVIEKPGLNRQENRDEQGDAR